MPAARPAPRTAPLLAPGLVLLLLAAPLAGVERAAAQGNATQPAQPAPGTAAAVNVPFQAEPGELLDVARGWLAALEGHIRDFRAAHPGRNTTLAEVFDLGAWDFLNESRVVLMQTQLYQGEAQLRLDAWFPDAPEGERRNATLQHTAEDLNASRAQLERFWARLAAAEGKLRTTHGLEYALFAAKTAITAETLLREAPNVTAQIPKVDVVDARVARLSTLFTFGPQVYAAEAGDLLDLALRVDAQARPPLPPGALDAGAAAVRTRLDTDPDASSVTGRASTQANELLQLANGTGMRVLYLARFIAFQEARAADAVEFRKGRGTLSEPQLTANLKAALQNASLQARYDGNLEAAEAEPLARARSAGYQGVLQVEARNQAEYTTYFEDRGQAGFSELSGAWDAMVGSVAAAWVERAMGTPQAADPGSLLLYGGIAVAAALVVGAFVFLRKPGA